MVIMINTNSEQLKLLLKEKENLTLEFKEKYSSRIDEDIVAFANTKGGIILLGVDDNGNVKGEELTNDLKAKINTLTRNCKPSISVNIRQIEKIVVLEIPEGDIKPYSCSTGYFRRLDGNTQKMDTEELKILFQKSDKIPFEEKFNEEATFEDISLKKLDTFLKESDVNINKFNLKEILYNLNAAKNDKINNAGILFFAKEPRKFIIQCQMTLIAFKGIDNVNIYDRRDVEDDLLTQFNEAIIFLEKHLNVRSEIKSINRENIYEIPFNALREAVANAIIHRDYNIRGTSIILGVYDNRVEITNPGGLAKGLSREDLGKLSIRRNELIADYFSRMNKVERVGSGIKRMKDAMKNENLPIPRIDINNSNSFFTITFKRPDKPIEKKTNKKTTQKTTQKILEIIKENPSITRAELADKIGISADGIKYHLKRLLLKEKIKRIGPDNGGYWKIIK